ncbi:MAG: signal recognition particle-docking protein FtsY [Dehalococcoidia bacterium]|nr:signal recognition particle-docking protein FtsY [Dehalococcoidia bacterium]
MFGWFKRNDLGLERSGSSWLGKINHLFGRASIGDETWDELEELLVLADVGVNTAAKLVEGVKSRVRQEGLTEMSGVKAVLKREMVNMLCLPPLPQGDDSDPQVILMVGVNGSGKTTSIAKLAYSFTSQGKRVVLAAADTFRAAAIDQLQYWGKEVNADVIAHRPGGDPGAVVYDAIQAAHSRHVPVVIIDTAGRLHTKFNLMEELKKIKRIASKHDMTAPQQVLLVMDATTGQNGLLQARSFADAVGVTGIFLAKLDSTARGGMAFAICDELHLPIVYIGTGENLQDMALFEAEAFVDAILY